MHEDAMAYPGDFVAANRTARTDAQHVALLRRKRRMPDFRRACFQIWETLTKRMPQRIYSRICDMPHHAIEERAINYNAHVSDCV